MKSNLLQLALSIAALASFMATAPAFAADQFVITAPAAKFSGIADRNGLTLISRVEQQSIYLVFGPEGVPPDEVIRRVKQDALLNLPGKIVAIEANASLPIAKVAGTAQLNASPVPVQNALAANRTLVDFYGDEAWYGFVHQPAGALVRITEAHQAAGTGGGIVAVIDTGVDPDHPLLRRWLIPGFDFTKELPGIPSELDDLDPETRSVINPSTTAILDEGNAVLINPSTTAILDANTAARLDPKKLPPGFGHGTMVAGIIRLGAPNARIMPLKAFDRDGQAKLFNVIRAIYYAQRNGAKVINMSMSVYTESEQLDQAIDDVEDKGVICVSSAGNNGRETEVWPAAFDDVIGTAATTYDDHRASFSNYGEELVKIAAPGEALIVPFPGNRYAGAWGTSFSTPLVAGAAVLMGHIRPGIRVEDVENALRKYAKRIADAGGRRLDFYDAVTAILYGYSLDDGDDDDVRDRRPYQPIP